MAHCPKAARHENDAPQMTQTAMSEDYYDIYSPPPSTQLPLMKMTIRPKLATDTPAPTGSRKIMGHSYTMTESLTPAMSSVVPSFGLLISQLLQKFQEFFVP